MHEKVAFETLNYLVDTCINAEPLEPYVAALVDCRDGEIVGISQRNAHKQDPTAHSEILAIRDWAESKRNKDDSCAYILVTTAEPCLMCSAAIAASHLLLGAPAEVYWSAGRKQLYDCGETYYGLSGCDETLNLTGARGKIATYKLPLAKRLKQAFEMYHKKEAP